MRAFTVSLNGRKIATAGVGRYGVLTAIVVWRRKFRERERLRLELGGIDANTDEHMDWTTPPLTVGDIVTIRIVETDAVDSEAARYAWGQSSPRPRKKPTPKRPRARRDGATRKKSSSA